MVALATGTAAFVLVMGSMAWACTAYQTSISALQPDVGVPGEQVSVRGEGAKAGEVVELRWNGTDGEVVGSGEADQNGRFAVEATLPVDEPGAYAVMATFGAGSSPARAMARLSAPVDENSPGATAGITLARSTGSWAGYSSGFGELDAPVSPAFGGPLGVGAAVLGIGLVTLAVGASGAAIRRRSPVSTRR